MARHWSATTRRRRAEGHRAGTLTLPAGYVNEHVDLGYAITVHRAQGSTVDSAHVVIGASMGREALYVAMTRGRRANNVYVTTSSDEAERHHATPADRSARDTLAAIISRPGVEPSARATADAEHDKWMSRQQLLDECEVIEQAAEQDLVVGIIERAGLPTDFAEQVLASPRLPELRDAVRRAAEHGHQPARILRVCARTWQPDSQTDPAAYLAAAFTQVLDLDWKPAGAPPRRHVPKTGRTALGPIPKELAQALEERRRLIQAMPLEPEPTLASPHVRQL